MQPRCFPRRWYVKTLNLNAKGSDHIQGLFHLYSSLVFNTYLQTSYLPFITNICQFFQNIPQCLGIARRTANLGGCKTIVFTSHFSFTGIPKQSISGFRKTFALLFSWSFFANERDEDQFSFQETHISIVFFFIPRDLLFLISIH